MRMNLDKNELYVRNDVSIANEKVGKNRLSIRTGLNASLTPIFRTATKMNSGTTRYKCCVGDRSAT
jgi:hypothetical protein